MEARLRRLGPNSKVSILKIPDECRTKVWLAGRGTCCQLYTKSKYASRKHFSITYKEQKYFISDLQSANGTFINDEKLAGEKMLVSGNIIGVGVPSDMQNSPDCIVYIFEINYAPLISATPVNSENHTVLKLQSNSATLKAPKLESSITHILQNQFRQEFQNEHIDVDTRIDDVEKTTLNDSCSSDVIVIDESPELEITSLDALSKPKPPKISKLDESVQSHKIEKNEEKSNDEKNEEKSHNVDPEDEDMMAYEALTQMDEEHIKEEPDLLNYSQVEELIELSDSEDDWTTGLKMDVDKSPHVLDGDVEDDGVDGVDEDDGVEGVDEDDDIMILETRIRQKDGNELPPITVEDDMTDTDKKWIGRLLKIKEEEFFKGSQEITENVESGVQNEVASETDMEVDEVGVEEQAANSTEADRFIITPCSVVLDRLPTNKLQNEIPDLPPKLSSRVEVPKTISKSVVSKKTVSFDMVPQIRYFEVPTRTRLTDSEKGRLRFGRIIFNICKWNTHWLEECKRVAPDKVPLGLCDETLRKIPKKFPNHSDYMTAFIPAVFLELWNKIKDNWVASGESRFRQTLSCDSCEDHRTENLSIYKCTGLVQNVNAHKNLLREGHLVLLRLHQVQVPEFKAPESYSKNYSKNLGYLVFGFVKDKIYERYQNQPLHRGLAERCTSVAGNLHITRLTILVKKRPQFQVDKQKLIQLTVVYQISEEIRMFKGICLLPDSPLCAAILKPTKTTMPPPEYTKSDLIFKDPLDEFQSEIVRKLSHACSSTSSLLYNIHGPSGTGKGQVVSALILQFLYGEEWKGRRPKIIYCTEWSIPLDETVTKLKALRQSFEEPFKLVRVGPIKEVKPLLRDLCVSSLAADLQNSNKRCLNFRNLDAEIEVIKEADVVCTRCTSAGMAKMCAAFEKILVRNRDRKIICIIDEAMSCRETDAVVPLLLGVTHLILVGDLYQMDPPFSGERAHSIGLDRPLFSRIYKNFMNVPREMRPITVLQTQYRMNSSLANFTGQLLYKNVVQNPSEDVPHKVATIRSHLLLLDQTPENLPKETELRAVRMVSQLVKAVVKLSKASLPNGGRFGVIMGDTKKIENLQVLLPKRGYPEVEINLIQSFQGREFDVVIFVCDGRKIATSWLTTALTRARRSLLILASQNSTTGNPILEEILANAGEEGFLKCVHADMAVSQLEELLV